MKDTGKFPATYVELSSTKLRKCIRPSRRSFCYQQALSLPRLELSSSYISIRPGTSSTDIPVHRSISNSPTISSLTPLFQVITQASSTDTAQATASPGSNHTGTSLFHTVLPSSTSTAYPVTSAAVTSASVAAPSEKSVGDRSQVPLAAVAVVLVAGLVGVK